MQVLSRPSKLFLLFLMPGFIGPSTIPAPFHNGTSNLNAATITPDPATAPPLLTLTLDHTWTTPSRPTSSEATTTKQPPLSAPHCALGSCANAQLNPFAFVMQVLTRPSKFFLLFLMPGFIGPSTIPAPFHNGTSNLNPATITPDPATAPPLLTLTFDHTWTTPSRQTSSAATTTKQPPLSAPHCGLGSCANAQPNPFAFIMQVLTRASKLFLLFLMPGFIEPSTIPAPFHNGTSNLNPATITPDPATAPPLLTLTLDHTWTTPSRPTSSAATTTKQPPLSAPHCGLGSCANAQPNPFAFVMQVLTRPSKFFLLFLMPGFIGPSTILVPFNNGTSNLNPATITPDPATAPPLLTLTLDHTWTTPSRQTSSAATTTKQTPLSTPHCGLGSCANAQPNPFAFVMQVLSRPSKLFLLFLMPGFIGPSIIPAPFHNGTSNLNPATIIPDPATALPLLTLTLDHTWTTPSRQTSSAATTTKQPPLSAPHCGLGSCVNAQPNPFAFVMQVLTRASKLFLLFLMPGFIGPSTIPAPFHSGTSNLNPATITPDPATAPALLTLTLDHTWTTPSRQTSSAATTTKQPPLSAPHCGLGSCANAQPNPFALVMQVLTRPSKLFLLFLMPGFIGPSTILVPFNNGTSNLNPATITPDPATAPPLLTLTLDHTWTTPSRQTSSAATTTKQTPLSTPHCGLGSCANAQPNPFALVMQVLIRPSKLFLLFLMSGFIGPSIIPAPFHNGTSNLNPATITPDPATAPPLLTLTLDHTWTTPSRQTSSAVTTTKQTPLSAPHCGLGSCANAQPNPFALVMQVLTRPSKFLLFLMPGFIGS
nr:mucin-2-like [Rhipicephalus microplus]